MSKRKQKGIHCKHSAGHAKCGLCGRKTCPSPACARLHPLQVLSRALERTGPSSSRAVTYVLCSGVCSARFLLGDIKAKYRVGQRLAVLPVDECEALGCREQHCQTEVRDEKDRWRRVCSFHARPYQPPHQTRTRFPSSEMKLHASEEV